MLALEAIVSALSFIALTLFIGQIVAAGFLLPGGDPRTFRASLLHGSLISLSAFLGIALIALFYQGAKIQRAIPSTELLWRYLTMTQSGHVWLGREAYGAALVLIVWAFVKKASGVKAVRTARASGASTGGKPQFDESCRGAARRRRRRDRRRRDPFNRDGALGRRIDGSLPNTFSRRQTPAATGFVACGNRQSLLPTRACQRRADYRYGCLSKLDPRRRFRNTGNYRLWERL